MYEQKAISIIEEYLNKFKPLNLELRKNWFEYDTTGNKAASQKLEKIELEIRTLCSDRDRFQKLGEILSNENSIKDPLLKRQVETLYLSHLPNQIDKNTLERLTKVERSLQETFNDYRAEVDGKSLTPVEVDHILSDSTDSMELEKVWKAQKSVGPLIEKDFRELVSIRNEIARTLGFADAIELSAKVNEFELSMLDEFYSNARKLTDEPFAKLKKNFIDPALSKRYSVPADKLEPWHYQNAFFQEAPNCAFANLDLDSMYAKVDSPRVVELVKEFYASMGIDVGVTINNSSLYPKEGKNPHAVAWLLDPERAGSSVLIMNLPEPPSAPKATDASTLVHELAHDVNYESILSYGNLPYLLREPTMLTEAFAMLMEKQSRTAAWFEKLGASPDAAKNAEKEITLIEAVDEIVFLRWAITIYDFEMAFYRDPSQDIGDLWWKCVERNQLLKRPKNWKNPDALSKYHIPNVSLLYYSNYAIGRVANVMFAKLFADKIGAGAKNVSYFDQKEFGKWLMHDFLAQGEKYRWDEFLSMYAKGPISVSAWKDFYITANERALKIKL